MQAISAATFRSAAFWILTLAVALVSWRFFIGGVEATMPAMLHHATARPLAFFAHVVLAPVALALTPLQFWTRLRMGRPRVHRWSGRVYGLSVLIAGTAGLYLAMTTAYGPVAGWGFGLLAVAWLATTAIGVRLAMAGDIARHRRWMTRSVALTFAAVTLRLYLAASQIAGIDFATAYVVIAWICWVPNLIVAEWMLRGGRLVARPA